MALGESKHVVVSGDVLQSRPITSSGSYQTVYIVLLIHNMCGVCILIFIHV